MKKFLKVYKGPHYPIDPKLEEARFLEAFQKEVEIHSLAAQLKRNIEENLIELPSGFIERNIYVCPETQQLGN